MSKGKLSPPVFQAPLTVLLVEDHAGYRDVVAAALASFLPGLVVEQADCVADALCILSERPVEAAITDMTLPDGSAIDFITQARAAVESPPAFIVISNHLQSAVSAPLAEHGIHHFVGKEQGLVALANTLVAACPKLAALR